MLYREPITPPFEKYYAPLGEKLRPPLGAAPSYLSVFKQFYDANVLAFFIYLLIYGASPDGGPDYQSRLPGPESQLAPSEHWHNLYLRFPARPSVPRFSNPASARAQHKMEESR